MNLVYVAAERNLKNAAGNEITEKPVLVDSAINGYIIHNKTFVVWLTTYD